MVNARVGSVAGLAMRGCAALLEQTPNAHSHLTQVEAIRKAVSAGRETGGRVEALGRPAGPSSLDRRLTLGGTCYLGRTGR